MWVTLMCTMVLDPFLLILLFLNRNNRYMVILAILQVKTDCNFMISQWLTQIKRSKIEKTIFV